MAGRWFFFASLSRLETVLDEPGHARHDPSAGPFDADVEERSLEVTIANLMEVQLSLTLLRKFLRGMTAARPLYPRNPADRGATNRDCDTWSSTRALYRSRTTRDDRAASLRNMENQWTSNRHCLAGLVGSRGGS